MAEIDVSIYDDYVGEFELSPSFAIIVRRKGDRLFAQATGQQEFEVFPSSETVFFLKVVEAELRFVRGGDGKINKIVLKQGGVETAGKRK